MRFEKTGYKSDPVHEVSSPVRNMNVFDRYDLSSTCTFYFDMVSNILSNACKYDPTWTPVLKCNNVRQPSNT